MDDEARLGLDLQLPRSEDVTPVSGGTRRGRKGMVLKKNREVDVKPCPTESPFKVGVCADKNARRRRKMEDGHSYFYDFDQQPGHGFFAIFDGHAGASASQWCEGHFHEVLARVTSQHRKAGTVISTQGLLNEAFTEADRSLIQANDIHSGCTAVVTLFKPKRQKGPDDTSLGRLYTGNVGDSRAILCRAGRAIRLTYDHKGSDPKEIRRIEEAGGFIANERVSGILAVTRALGDEEMKDFVSGKPYTTKVSITPADEFIILACDGLWDVCTDQKAVELIRDVEDPQVASEQLVDYAIDNGSTDNLSVMVVRFLRPG